jgi:RHS repeat-associated protein
MQAYNAAGNIVSDGQFTFAYNNAGRLISRAGPTAVAPVTRRTYDGKGMRVSTITRREDGGSSPASDSRHFFHDDGGNLLGEYNTMGIPVFDQEFVWFNGLPVAVAMPGQAIGYIYADHLATPRTVIDSLTTAERWHWDSEPFGSTGTVPPGSGFNLRFPGQQYDRETGLHYNGMRDYVPKTGRYLQSDPTGLNGGLSRYTYVSGDPLSRTDSSGLAGVAGTTANRYLAANPSTQNVLRLTYGGASTSSALAPGGTSSCDDTQLPIAGADSCEAVRDSILQGTCSSIKSTKKRAACVAAAWLTYFSCLSQK